MNLKTLHSELNFLEQILTFETNMQFFLSQITQAFIFKQRCLSPQRMVSNDFDDDFDDFDENEDDDDENDDDDFDDDDFDDDDLDDDENDDDDLDEELDDDFEEDSSNRYGSNDYDEDNYETGIESDFGYEQEDDY